MNERKEHNKFPRFNEKKERKNKLENGFVKCPHCKKGITELRIQRTHNITVKLRKNKLVELKSTATFMDDAEWYCQECEVTLWEHDDNENPVKFLKGESYEY